MNVKKVIFLTRLYSPHIGGVEKHVEKLSEQLIKHNFEVTILTEQFDKNIREKESKNRTKIVRIPKNQIKTKLNIWKWIINHKNLINQSDIIHAHDVFWWYIPLRFLYPNKPIFTTFHGYEGHKLPRWQAIIHRKIAEILSTGTICIGSFMKKWYYAKPDIVSYGGAELKPIPLLKKTSSIFIGRLGKDTGIMDYLKAIKLLAKPIPLTVYGDGPQRGLAEKYAKKHNLPVIFKDFVLNASQYLKNYQFAFVSRYLAILEAMQTKRLVFAHYNNAIKKDYLTCHPQAKNMFIFNKSEVLATHLQKIINNSKITQNKINNAYQWAKTQTWNNLANQYLKLWGIS